MTKLHLNIYKGVVLLPCPFCGNEVEYDAGGCSEYYGHEHQNVWVECPCGAELIVSDSQEMPCSCCYNRTEELFKRWNMRV